MPRHSLNHYCLLVNHTIGNKPDCNVTPPPRACSWLYIATRGLCKKCILRNIITQCMNVVCTGPMLADFLIKWDVVLYVLSPRQLGQITFATLWSMVPRQQIISPALLQFCCRRLVRTLLVKYSLWTTSVLGLAYPKYHRYYIFYIEWYAKLTTYSPNLA